MTLLSKGAVLLPIRSPNARGISYNQYPGFHVGPEGVLLHLRDHVPHKANEPIQIILEVVGKEASHLQGLLKVAGMQANVIIANANGITCQGGWFINTTHVLLTTGQLLLSPEGKLKTHQVTQGTLKLERAAKQPADSSLNWQDLDQVDLLARAVQFNTKLYVKHLTVITGHYKLPHLDSFEDLPTKIEPLDEATADIQPPAVAIAIDAGGDIYAQHLRLMSREYDVDIKSAGRLHADHLRLDSQGRVDVSGNLKAQTASLKAENIFQAGQACAGNIELHSQYQCHHPGTTQAEQLTITAPLLELNGQLEAHDSLQIKGHYIHHTGQVTAGRDLAVQAQQQLSATGSWRAGFSDNPSRAPGHLTLQSNDLLQSTGLHQASGNICIEGSRLELSGSSLHTSKQLNLKALQDSILLNNAETRGTHVLIETPRTLRHRGSTLTSHQLQLTAAGLLNRAGKIYHHRPSPKPFFSTPRLSQASEFVLIRSRFLNNSHGLIHIAHDCALRASRLVLNNTRGKLMAGRSLTLELKALHNRDGRLQAGQDLNLSLPHLTRSGTLSAGQTLRLNLSTDYRHTQANTFVAPKLFLETTGAWINASSLSNSQKLYLQAAQLDNHSSGLINSNQTQLYLTEHLTNQGRIYGEHIRLATSSLCNKAIVLVEPPKAPLRTVEHTGLISARQTLYLGTQQLHNLAGSLISSEGSLHIGGHLSLDGAVNGLTRQVLNYSAILEAQGPLKLQSHTLGNENGYFIAEIKCLSAEERLEYQPTGEEKRYSKDEIHWVMNENFPGFSLPKENDRKVCHFTQYHYIRTYEKTLVTYSYPARVQSGQDMKLSGHITNEKSQILAGGTLSEIAGLPYRLDTRGERGQRIYRDKGYSRGTYLDFPNSFCQSNFLRLETQLALLEPQWQQLPPTLQQKKLHERALQSLSFSMQVARQVSQLWLKKKLHYYPKTEYQHVKTEYFDLLITPTHRIVSRITANSPTETHSASTEPNEPPLRYLPHFNWLPIHGLYTFRAGPYHPYFSDVDTQFLAPKASTIPRALSSDYLLREKLQLATLPKRFGSGHYEQHQIREQIQWLTHQRYLPGQTSDEATFRKLMDAAHGQSKSLGLKVGIPLNPEQINQLKQDIVWMVNQTVTLSDNQQQTVLVPQVYLALGTPSQTVHGALVSARNIVLKVQMLRNSGSTLLSQKDIQIEAEAINNRRGKIVSQGNFQLKTAQSLDNTAGQLAGKHMILKAGDDILLGSQTQKNESLNVNQTVLNGTAQLQAKILQLTAGRHLELQAAQLKIEEKGHLKAGEYLKVDGIKISETTRLNEYAHLMSKVLQEAIGNQTNAKGDLHFEKKDLKFSDRQSPTDEYYYQMTKTQPGPVQSQINAEGNLHLEAKNIEVIGGEFSSKEKLHVEATGGMLQFKTGYHQESCTTNIYKMHDNPLTLIERQENQQTQTIEIALPSSLRGAQVQLQATGDLHATGLQITDQAGVQIDTQGALHWQSAINTYKSQQEQCTNSLGLLIEKNPLLGEKDKQCHTNHSQVFHTKSQIHTQRGLTVRARRGVYLEGTELAAGESLQLVGSHIEIKAATDTQHSETKQEQTQTGLSPDIVGGVAAIADKANRELQAASEAQSTALRVTKRLQAAYTVGSVLSRHPNCNYGVAAKELCTSLASGDLDKALQASGLAAEARLGRQSQSQSVDQTTHEAQTSCLKAPKIHIQTHDDNLTISGTQLQGKRVTLESAGDIAVQQTPTDTHTTQAQKHWQAKFGTRVGVMGGTQAFVEGQRSTQNQSQSSTTGEQSVLEAEECLEIRSKGDTRLEGVQARGTRVIGQVGGDFILKSTQATSEETIDALAVQGGVGVPVGPGWAFSSHIGGQHQSTEAKSKSVKQQTTLQVGTDGCDITVGNKTQLIGGRIQAEAPSERNRLMTETIQYTPIENETSYQQYKPEVQLNTGQGMGSMLLQQASSGISFWKVPPRVKSGVTQGSLEGVQVRLSSKEGSPASPSPQPQHEPVSAFDTAAMAEQSALGETVSQLGMQLSGDIMDWVEERRPPGLETQVLRTALHAGVAGGSAMLSEQSTAGAVAGVVAGDMTTYVGGQAESLQALRPSLSNLAQNAMAGLAGSAAGFIVDGKAGASSGGSQAFLSDRWNRQLHLNEAKELDRLLRGKSAEERQRLLEAAAYLTRMSAGVPYNDPRRAELQAMQARGQWHTTELTLLKNTHLFKYTIPNRLKDWQLQQDEIIQRELGSLHAAIGLNGVAAGISIIASSTVFTIPISIPLGLLITATSGYMTVQGARRNFGPYSPIEGDRVLASLDLSIYPGEPNQAVELASEVGLIFVPSIAGKLTTCGVSFFGRANVLRQAKSFLKPGGNLLGGVMPGTTKEVRTVSEVEFEYVKSRLIKMGLKLTPKSTYDGMWYKLPHEAGEVGFRESTESGKTIDFHIRGYLKGLKLHQNA